MVLQRFLTSKNGGSTPLTPTVSKLQKTEEELLVYQLSRHQKLKAKALADIYDAEIRADELMLSE
jgi:hypothetical protein